MDGAVKFDGNRRAAGMLNPLVRDTNEGYYYRHGTKGVIIDTACPEVWKVKAMETKLYIRLIVTLSVRSYFLRVF